MNSAKAKQIALERVDRMSKQCRSCWRHDALPASVDIWDAALGALATVTELEDLHTFFFSALGIPADLMVSYNGRPMSKPRLVRKDSSDD